MSEDDEDYYGVDVLLDKLGFTMVKLLGTGTYGSVYAVAKDGREYALKVIHIRKDNNGISSGSALTEISASMMLKHPYIIRSHDIIIHNDAIIDGEGFVIPYESVLILMDLADNTLEDTLNFEDSLGYDVKLRYIYQIGTALDYISKLGYVFCDLKMNNILVKDGVCLLSDFSLFKHKDALVEICHQWGFRPPEESRDEYGVSYLDKFPDMADDYHRWEKNYTKMEMWAYGAICINIIYNRANILTKPIGSTIRDDGYDMFIKIMVDGYRSGKDAYTTLVNAIGSPPEGSEHLLRLVVDSFMSVNQDDRVNCFREFLGSVIFRDIDIPELEAYNHKPLAKPMISCKMGVYTAEDLDRATSWMLDVCSESLCRTYTTFAAVDYFLQNVNTYVNTKRELMLFASVCIWIYTHITDDAYRPFPGNFKVNEEFNVGLVLKGSQVDVYPIPWVDPMDSVHSKLDKMLQKYRWQMSDILRSNPDKYDVDEMIKMALHVVEYSGGLFLVDSIFDYIHTIEDVIVASLYVCNVRRYIELGGPRGLSLYMYSSQPDRVAKPFHRLPKTVLMWYLDGRNTEVAFLAKELDANLS